MNKEHFFLNSYISYANSFFELYNYIFFLQIDLFHHFKKL